MTHRPVVHAPRDTLGVPRLLVALVLLGLMAMSGCHSDGSSGSPQLQSLQVTPTNPSVAKGTSAQLTATGIYSDNSHADLTAQVTWATSDAAVATIGANTGQALGIVAGTATLSASLQGLSAATTLRVTGASLLSIALTPPIPSIAAGTSEQFTATGTFSDNTTENLTAELTWTSSHTAIATVSSSGLGSAVSAGSATISATCKVASTCGSLAGSTVLTVVPATLVSLAITPPAPSIALGTSVTFSATGTYSDHSTQNLTSQVTWTSATPAVATISNAGSAGSAGAATAVAQGTTLVTAMLGSVKATAVTLTVTPATLVSIAITPPAPSIALGTSETLTATGTYSDHSTQNLTSQVTWTSATPSVATISNAAGSAGVATPVAPGTTFITAALGSVKAMAVTLTVTPATLVSIAVTPTGPSIPVADTEQFIATGTYSDHSTQVLTSTVTWASSVQSIASISNATGSPGLATGLTVGSTSISAALDGVPSPTVTLTITAQVESVLYSFAGNPDGGTPAAGLIQGTDGNFYGTTEVGGANNYGTVFKITPAGVETVLYSFMGGSDGEYSAAELVQGSDGNFYGTTVAGGTNDYGTVFKITPAGVETVLYTFTGGNDGGNPAAALIQGPDGNFYGTTENGGTSAEGTVFRITPAGVETVLYTFTGANDGANPAAGLILGTDGNFYGTTQYGGPSNDGTAFEVTPAGIETVLYSFTGGNDGERPVAGLLKAADGNFYGMTVLGGTAGSGAIFKITSAGLEAVLYSFTGGNDGGTPQAGLTQAADGNFYGTTQYGGTSNFGALFKITPAGVETTLYSFTGGSDGEYTQAGLLQAADGNFYGTTPYGGTAAAGTVFKF